MPEPRRSFVDGLYSLDARATKARLAVAFDAARMHRDGASPEQRQALETAIAEVQAATLAAARAGVERLQAAIDASRSAEPAAQESPPPAEPAPAMPRRPTLPPRPLRPLGRQA